MERVEIGGRVIIRYEVKDRVMVMTEHGQVRGTIVYLGKYRDAEHAFDYGVRLDGEKFTRKIGQGQIVKQADEGVMGRTRHLEAF